MDHSLKIQQSKHRDFVDVLRGTVVSIVPDVDVESIEKAVNQQDLNWDTVRGESEENVVGKLQMIEDLSYVQCLEVYRVIRNAHPKVVRLEMGKRLSNIYHVLYLKFMEHCTSSLNVYRYVSV